MFKLVIQDDEGKTTVVPLIRDEITVGRKEGNTIRLTERNVSRRHARIVRNNGTIAIEDLESYNGVRVNGGRIKGRQPLTVSDRIQIGDYLIELKIDSDENLINTPDDQLTQPIEKPEPPGAAATGSIPIPQVGPNAETTKMPSQLLPNHLKNEMFSSVVSAVATPAPVLDPTPHPAAATEAPPGKGPKPSRKVKGSPDGTPVTDEARHARLVVMSSNFAGVEYELTEPSTVLGRTDENDIVINHRSISRNHAKILREGASYTIVDLQSSNGVRVNNEEYDKVQLHRGDLVDLGHVRLRFADPGDDYVFKPEDVSDVSTGSSKGVWYALLAVLVVLVGVGLFALVSDGDSKDRQQGGAGTDATTATASGAGKSEFDLLMAEAQKAIAQGDWSVASVKAREAQSSAGSDTTAQQAAQKVIDQAASEEAAKSQFEALQQAVARKDYAQIKAHYAAIGPQSSYRPDATTMHDAERDAYIEGAVRRAEDFLARGACQKIREVQKAADAAWPEARERVAEILEACQKPQQPNPPVNPTRLRPGNDTVKPPDPTPPVPDDPPPDPRAPTRSVEELVAEAEEAGRKGLHGQSRRLCEQALDLKPRDAQANLVCAIAACNLNNERLAKRYYANAPTGEQKGQIYQICLAKKINLRP
jgi:pSer/pThr/pTyr-binding forkhead associated (FHA) protein